MPVFELQTNGKTYEVDAPNMEAASSAFQPARTTPADNWSNIGAENLNDAGITPAAPPAPRPTPLIAPRRPVTTQSVVVGPYEQQKALAPNQAPQFTAPTMGQIGSDWADAARNGAIGLATGTPGILGNTLASAQRLPSIATLNPSGVTSPTMPETMADMPTSENIGNYFFGKATTPTGQGSRMAGEILSPLAWGRSAQLLLRALGGPNTALAPQDIGTQYVKSTMDKAGVTSAELETTAAQTDKPITAAEAIGPQGQTNLMALARRPGETADAVQAQLGARAADRTDRILGDMAQAAGIHPDAAKGNIDALVQAGQQQAAPLFQQALGGNGPVWNNELADLTKRPAIQGAMRTAAEQIRNQGLNPVAYGLEVDPMMGATGAKQLQPTAQAWDLVRKTVNGQLERNPFGVPLPDSAAPGNYGIKAASKDLTGALKDAIPGYSDALDVSGDYLSSKSAFDLGTKAILDRSMDATDFAKAFNKLSPAEQTALKGGIANRLYSLSQNGALKPSQYMTPAAQQKLAVALGPDAAKNFISSLGDEAAMRAFETRAVPAAGSQTAPLTQAMKDQDAFGSNAVTDALGSVAQHGVQGTITRAGAGVLKNLGSRIQTTGLNEAARNQAGRLLLMPPGQLAAFLRAPAAVPSAAAVGANLSPGFVGASALPTLPQLLLASPRPRVPAAAVATAQQQ